MNYGIIWAIVALLLIAYSLKKIVNAKPRKTNPYENVCFHTRLDCENCVSYPTCGQTNGPGLINSKKGEE